MEGIVSTPQDASDWTRKAFGEGDAAAPLGRGITGVPFTAWGLMRAASSELGFVVTYFDEAVMDYCAHRRPTGEVLWNKIREWAGQISSPEQIEIMGDLPGTAWGDLEPAQRAAIDTFTATRIAAVDAIARHFPPAPPAPMFVQGGPVPIDETIFEQGDAIGDRDEHRAAAVDAAYAAAPAPIEEVTTSIDDVDDDEDPDEGDLDDEGLDAEDDDEDPDEGDLDDEGLDAEDDGDRQEAIARMDDEMGTMPVCADPGDGSACGAGDPIRTLEVGDEPEAITDGDKMPGDPPAPRRRR